MLRIIRILKKPKHLLILILFFTTLLRVTRLDFPNKFVFDEVYHAFTAQEFLKGNIEAWEWWTTPPPGVAYEWTHPPLAKEIMAVSMLLLNSQEGWAWRLPGTALGIFSVYLVYLLGKKLLKSEVASLIAAFAFSIDGLNFVQSRIGMNDIYYITFMLLSLYFFLNKKFLLSAIMLGLSLSSKWAALYTYIIYMPLLMQRRLFKQLIILIIIPTLIYFLTYGPFFILGHNFNQFIDLHKQMWWYHTNLKAAHDYASPAWSWPFNLYPVWYFVDYQNNLIANIFSSGNPILLWLGFVSILLTLWETIRKKSVNLFILSLGFFAFWLPWLASPRIMFLYHFSASIPFLCLALGHQISKEIIYPKDKWKIFLFIIILSLGFALIYPFLIAIHLPKDFMMLFFYTNLTKNPF